MKLHQILFLSVLVLFLFSSCEKDEDRPVVLAGIYNTEMIYYEFNPSFQPQFQTDSLKGLKYGIDSIDIDSDGSFDFLISQRINLNWSDNIPRGYLEKYNFPFCGLSLKNGLEIAYKNESFPTGLGTSSSTMWVDTLPYEKRIDKIMDWHDSNLHPLDYKGYYNKTIWMCGVPPGSAWWGSYGYWHYLLNVEMYIGVRMKINSEYKFGWVKVKVNSQDNFEILSYAIEK